MKNLFFFTLICAAIGIVSCENNKKQDKEVNLAQDAIPLDTLSNTDTVAKETTTEVLEEVLEKIAKAYTDQDSKTINSFIHPKLGIYIIFRPGAVESYVHQDNFSFSKPIPADHAYGKLSYKGPLKEEKLPKFDCGTMKWEKSGFFYDNTSHPNQLSHTANMMKEISDAKISTSELQQIKNMEAKSYRAIMTSNENEKPFVFQVTQEGEKWYITLIDRVYAGCEV